MKHLHPDPSLNLYPLLPKHVPISEIIKLVVEGLNYYITVKLICNFRLYIVSIVKQVKRILNKSNKTINSDKYIFHIILFN